MAGIETLLIPAFVNAGRLLLSWGILAGLQGGSGRLLFGLNKLKTGRLATLLPAAVESWDGIYLVKVKSITVIALILEKAAVVSDYLD